MGQNIVGRSFKIKENDVSRCITILSSHATSKKGKEASRHISLETIKTLMKTSENAISGKTHYPALAVEGEILIFKYNTPHYHSVKASRGFWRMVLVGCPSGPSTHGCASQGDQGGWVLTKWTTHSHGSWGRWDLQRKSKLKIEKVARDV